MGTMKPAQPTSITIRQIEFELEKAEHGMALSYDTERVAQLRSMLREARKQKLSAGLRVRRKRATDDHAHHALQQGSLRCDGTRCPADAVQVAPRSKGLVQGALPRLADHRDRKGCIKAGGDGRAHGKRVMP